MRTFIEILCLLTTLPVLLASTCPTQEPQRTPILGAPRFVSHDITGVKTGNVYRESIFLIWEPPSGSYATIESYTILHSIHRDSNYVVLLRNIPPQVTSYYNRLEHPDFPVDELSREIRYRIFATDSLGRRSRSLGRPIRSCNDRARVPPELADADERRPSSRPAGGVLRAADRGLARLDIRDPQARREDSPIWGRYRVLVLPPPTGR